MHVLIYFFYLPVFTIRDISLCPRIFSAIMKVMPKV